MENSRVFPPYIKVVFFWGFGVPKIELGAGKIPPAGTVILSAVPERTLSPDPKKNIDLTQSVNLEKLTSPSRLILKKKIPFSDRSVLTKSGFKP